MDTLVSLFAFAGIAGFFYFRKKDTKKRNISIAVSVISFFLFGMFFGDNEGTKEEVSNGQGEVVKIEKDEENEDETENIKEDVKSEPVTVDGAIYKLDNKEWTEEFKFVDEEDNEYIVISNSEVPKEYMTDGLIYRISGEKEEDSITLTDYEVFADDWDSYQSKITKEKEIKEIEATVKERVSDEYTQASILDLRINEHLGTEDNDDDYIVLAYLIWDRKNKAETTRGMLERYSDDLAATLAKHQNIEEITVFWEVPYHLEGSNSVKTNYLRCGERMAIEDRWFDPVLR